MSKCDATCVRRGIVEGRGNCLSGAVTYVEKLVIMRELAKKMWTYLAHQIPYRSN